MFDRRCRTDTALAKLARLRQRVRRFRSLGRTLDKLNSPNLEKALKFLDDKLLPATSNAVERGNRRLRKMQKTVYRVRTQQSLKGSTGLGPPTGSASRQSPSNLGGPAQGPQRAR